VRLAAGPSAFPPDVLRAVVAATGCSVQVVPPLASGAAPMSALLRAHGLAVQAYRATSGKRPIGLVVNLEPKYPASQEPADLAATARADAYMNRQFLDPVFRGHYPEELARMFGAAWPRHPDSDFEAIRTPIDFLGVNYYTRSVTRHDPRHKLLRAGRVVQKHQTYTETKWEVYPQGLADTLLWVRERYGKLPIYVTENGAAFYDPPTAAGDVVEDPLRAAYLREHIRAVRSVIDRGVDIRGYFVWSLLDNFEWSHGYSKRFGIVHVDYATQKRTPKSSARFYSDVIRTNGSSLK
jgi:beta-glucosidase